jgi:hypothetical protein
MAPNTTNGGEVMKVYVVTAGDYSDRHVVGIFSTNEKANDFIKTRQLYYQPYMYDYPHDRAQEYELDRAAHPGTVIAEYNPKTGEIVFTADSDYEAYPYFDKFSQLVYFEVFFNPNKDVMMKSVYHQYAGLRAQKEGM